MNKTTTQSDKQHSVPAEASKASMPVAYPLLWLLVLFSLLLNVLILRQLLDLRSSAAQAVTDAIVMLDGFEDQTFSYTVVVDETFVLDTDLPIDTSLPVSINEILPVNTTVSVAVDADLLGTIPLTIPIETTVPIDLDFEVPIDQSFHFTAAVPIYFEVPIELGIGDTPFGDTLRELQIRLMELEIRLNAPLIPLPGGGNDDVEIESSE